ncbi:MAG TPA: hypothetical protein VJ044_01585, partial [Candidatus Hodarchaeales archaeon]|nr:hypothetical protein [Candidatus Hodarchaeales archaeon]
YFKRFSLLNSARSCRAILSISMRPVGENRLAEAQTSLYVFSPAYVCVNELNFRLKYFPLYVRVPGRSD